MGLSNEERIAKLEELLSRVEGRRDRSAPEAEEQERVSEPEVLDLAESEDVIELTDEDELEMVEASDEEDIPMIPEEFEEEPPAPIEVVAKPEAPMEIEPPAPSEPGAVSPEAHAAAPVEPIDVPLPPLPEARPVEAEEPPETTLELHPTEPKPRELPPTQAMPVIPEPVEPARAEPPATRPQPLVPEPETPLPPVLEPRPEPRPPPPRTPEPLPRREVVARPAIADARPAAFAGEVPRRKPLTMGQILRAAFRVGEK